MGGDNVYIPATPESRTTNKYFWSRATIGANEEKQRKYGSAFFWNPGRRFQKNNNNLFAPIIFQERCASWKTIMLSWSSFHNDIKICLSLCHTPNSKPGQWHKNGSKTIMALKTLRVFGKTCVQLPTKGTIERLLICPAMISDKKLDYPRGIDQRWIMLNCNLHLGPKENEVGQRRFQLWNKCIEIPRGVRFWRANNKIWGIGINRLGWEK